MGRDGMRRCTAEGGDLHPTLVCIAENSRLDKNQSGGDEAARHKMGGDGDGGLSGAGREARWRTR